MNIPFSLRKVSEKILIFFSITFESREITAFFFSWKKENIFYEVDKAL